MFLIDISSVFKAPWYEVSSEFTLCAHNFIPEKQVMAAF